MSGRICAVVLLAVGLGGCLSSGDVAQVTGNPVNPTPVGDYRVRCSTLPVISPISTDHLVFCGGYYGSGVATVRARG